MLNILIQYNLERILESFIDAFLNEHVLCLRMLLTAYSWKIDYSINSMKLAATFSVKNR